MDHSKNLAIIFTGILILSIVGIAQTASAHPPPNPCNCVIIRFDDVTDWWAWKVQLRVMDYHIQEKKPMSLAIVMNKIGFDSQHKVENKVKQGLAAGVFELGIHGWNHDDHSTKSLSTTMNEMKMSQDKMQSLFGQKSKIFIPPRNKFSDETIYALTKNGIPIFSTADYAEQRDPLSNPIYYNPYKVDKHFDSADDPAQDNAILHLSKVEGVKVYHAMYEFSLMQLYNRGLKGDALVNQALVEIDESIAERGFAMVVLHQIDFQKVTSDGTKLNEVDETKFTTYKNLIGNLTARGTPFKKIQDVTPV